MMLDSTTGDHGVINTDRFDLFMYRTVPGSEYIALGLLLMLKGYIVNLKDYYL